MDKPELLVVGILPDWDLAPLAERFTLRKLYEAPDPRAFLAEHGPNIRGIATKGELGADAAMIAACPKLEVIACYGVGVDAIDLAAARARGIPVTNTPDVLTEEVADLAFALLLATARAIPEADRYVRSGDWAAKGPMRLATRVWGKRLGIVGLGRIGQAIARRAQAFGMSVAYTSRTRKDVPLPYFANAAELAANVDFLVVITPGGAATRHLIDARVLQALGPQGYLVNVSRGSVVDEAALVDALQRGTIAGAALDVFENEPRVPPALRELDNVVLTPHIASATIPTRLAMANLAADNLIGYLVNGKPLTPLNPEVLV